MSTLRNEGVRAFLHQLRGFLAVHAGIGQLLPRVSVPLPTDARDLVGADFSVGAPRAHSPGPVGDGPYTINWVVPPPGASSGGHQNIFRFVRSLEAAGHCCRIYFHDAISTPSLESILNLLRKHFPPMDAEVHCGAGDMAPCDAMIATSWTTAYPVYTSDVVARRFYFVQDFEPSFYPVGSDSTVAENTYRFGFHGVTAGAWLAHKLQSEYGMRCAHYDFAVDRDRYHLLGDTPRDKVFFYARPVTPRRAFELGVLALQVFARERPGVEIHLAGWDVRQYRLPFAHVDHGVMSLDELNPLYNQLSAALVLSLTNMSLLPLELLSSGCIPVMNDAPNNRMVSDNPCIRYVPPTPAALARELAAVAGAADLKTQAQRASDSVRTLSWTTAGEVLEHVLRRELCGNRDERAFDVRTTEAQHV